VRQLILSEDGAGSACVAINVDECRSLDAIVALPADREGGISLFDVDRFGVSVTGQPCSELVGRVKQPGIASFGREAEPEELPFLRSCHRTLRLIYLELELLCDEALGENAQRDGLVGAGGAGDEGEAAFADELLDAPAERLDAARLRRRGR
jgi:hypothetical protein